MDNKSSVPCNFIRQIQIIAEQNQTMHTTMDGWRLNGVSACGGVLCQCILILLLYCWLAAN